MKTKLIVLVISLFSTATLASELELVKSVNLTPELKLRGYVEGKGTPESLTAYGEASTHPNCQLSYIPTSKRITSDNLVLIGTEPKYNGGRVEIYSLNTRMSLNVKSTLSKVSEQPQRCYATEPEFCDENPPLVKVKSVHVEMNDADQNRWMLFCISDEVLSADGQVPSVNMTDVMNALPGVSLN